MLCGESSWRRSASRAVFLEGAVLQSTGNATMRRVWGQVRQCAAELHADGCLGPLPDSAEPVKQRTGAGELARRAVSRSERGQRTL